MAAGAEASDRLFVAVLLPAGVREALGELIERGKQKGTDVRWTRKENLHITLKFLGDVRRDGIPHLIESLKETAAQRDAFNVTVQGLGAFPSAGRPRVLWAGIAEGTHKLESLAAAVEGTLRPLGFGNEERFSGHITLGRLRRPEPALWFREWSAQERMEPLKVRVESFWLMKSTLTPAGPRYEALAEFALGSGAETRSGRGAEE
jgi:2'-5' RNA ligase